MRSPLIISSVAEKELAEATLWYDDQGAGKGERFAMAVDDVLDRISLYPEFAPRVHKDAREALVSGYPYQVIYRIVNGRVFVIAVFHSKRDPSIWEQRI